MNPIVQTFQGIHITGIKYINTYVLIIWWKPKQIPDKNNNALTRWHMPNWCGIWSQCGNSSSMSFTSKNMPAVLAGNTYQQSLLGGLESRKRSTLEAGATTRKHRNTFRKKLQIICMLTTGPTVTHKFWLLEAWLHRLCTLWSLVVH